MKADLGHRPRWAAAETRLEEDADAGGFASLKQTRLSAEVLRTEADPVERSYGFMLSGQRPKNTGKNDAKQDVHPEYRRMSCRKPCRRLCLMEPFMGKASCPDDFACAAIMQAAARGMAVSSSGTLQKSSRDIIVFNTGPAVPKAERPTMKREWYSSPFTRRHRTRTIHLVAHCAAIDINWWPEMPTEVQTGYGGGASGPLPTGVPAHNKTPALLHDLDAPTYLLHQLDT